MAKPKKKPDYDANKIMKGLLDVVAESYEQTGELKLTAQEFGISALKIRKLLITAGVYHSEVSDKVNMLYASGKSLEEIRRITGLGRSSVNGYLPYTKVIYNPKEASLNAERIRMYRRRRRVLADLMDDMTIETLWEAVVAFQGYPFYTASRLPFAYELRKGRGAEYNRELIVDRRKEHEHIDWNSFKVAFYYALSLHGKEVERLEDLGDIPGISYIYPMLYRFGIINVPDAVAERNRWPSRFCYFELRSKGKKKNERA